MDSFNLFFVGLCTVEKIVLELGTPRRDSGLVQRRARLIFSVFGQKTDIAVSKTPEKKLAAYLRNSPDPSKIPPTFLGIHSLYSVKGLLQRYQ